MQEINSNLMQSIIKQGKITFMRNGNYYSNDGVAFTGLKVEDGQITHTTLSTIEEIKQWLEGKDLKLEELMKKHANDLTEEEHDMVLNSFKKPEVGEFKENVENSNYGVKLTNEELVELADLAMRSPEMSTILRSKLFIGVQAIKEHSLERILRDMKLRGIL